MSYLYLHPLGTLDNTAAPVRNPTPFVHKSNTLLGDRIVVPVGWDSVGKLRGSFNAKAWGRHGSAICCRRTRSATPARENVRISRK